MIDEIIKFLKFIFGSVRFDLGKKVFFTLVQDYRKYESGMHILNIY